MPFAGYLLLLVWLASVGDPYYGLAVGVVYGVARAVPLLVSGFTQLRTPDSRPDPLRLMLTRLLWQPLNGIALILFGGLLLQSLAVTLL